MIWAIIILSIALAVAIGAAGLGFGLAYGWRNARDIALSKRLQS